MIMSGSSESLRGCDYPAAVLIFGDPGPLPRWFWVAVAFYVAVLIALMPLGAGAIAGVLLVIGIVAFLLFTTPRILKQMRDAGGLGKPEPKDRS